MDDAAARAVATDGTVRARVEATRSLALFGDADAMATLVGFAVGDPSPAVRMHAAAASVDLGLRLRWRDAQSAAAVVDVVRQQVGTVSVTDHPGLIGLYSAIADDDAIDALSRLIRDRRAEVRQGAAWAVRRLALAAHGQSHPKLIGAVRRWVVGRRLPPDALAEILSVVGDSGWPGMDAVLDAAVGAGPAIAAVVERARANRAALADSAAWKGLWVDLGRDVLGVGGPSLGGWVWVGDGVWRQRGVRERFRVRDGEGHRTDGRVRRLQEPGEPPKAAIQFDGQTAWRVDAAPVSLDEARDVDIDAWVSGWWAESEASAHR